MTSATLLFLQVSVAGVTGAQSQVASRVEGLLTDLRTATDKPIAVGFGISTGEHAAQVRLEASLIPETRKMRHCERRILNQDRHCLRYQFEEEALFVSALVVYGSTDKHQNVTRP